MIRFDHPEYLPKARKSSNLMLHHDGELMQGEFEEAGLAIWEAGLLRLEMSRLAQREDDIPRAICDALSASACFISAGDAIRANRALQDADAVGPIPSNREDIRIAREQRGEGVRNLQREQDRFDAEFRQSADRPHDAVLARLLDHWRRQFPGWSRLYALLACLENEAGRLADAARHARLAATFDPESPLLVALALLARAKVEPLSAVLPWGTEQLQRFADDPSIRVVLAYLQAAHATGPSDYQEALRILGTLPRDQPLPLPHMVFVRSLSAFLGGQLGQADLRETSTRELSALRTQLDASALPAPVRAELRETIEAATNGKVTGERPLEVLGRGLFLIASAA